MQYNMLGQLFEVSAYTLGGGGIGQVWGETSREEAVATVREAYDAGITLFDCTPLIAYLIQSLFDLINILNTIIGSDHYVNNGYYFD